MRDSIEIDLLIILCTSPISHERQKEILAYVLSEGAVTNRWCRARFNVVYNTAYRDLQGLVDLGLIEPVGSGRSARYVPKGDHA